MVFDLLKQIGLSGFSKSVFDSQLLASTIFQIVGRIEQTTKWIWTEAWWPGKVHSRYSRTSRRIIDWTNDCQGMFSFSASFLIGWNHQIENTSKNNILEIKEEILDKENEISRFKRKLNRKKNDIQEVSFDHSIIWDFVRATGSNDFSAKGRSYIWRLREDKGNWRKIEWRTQGRVLYFRHRHSLDNSSLKNRTDFV